jgi:uncharacterized protein (TIRG00374 family)
LVYLFTQGISAARWTTLARPLGIKTPFTAMLRYYLIGMFFNLFAPGTVGGDVTRVYYLVKDEDARAKGHAVTTVNAAMSVLMDRAIGMIVLVWLGALGLWFSPWDFLPSAYCCLCCDAYCPKTAIRWWSSCGSRSEAIEPIGEPY